MEESDVTIGEHLTRRGVSRRQFLKFCGLMTATLALPSAYTSRVAQALTAAPRPRVIWLEFQDCTGDSESFLHHYPVQRSVYLHRGRLHPDRE